MFQILTFSKSFMSVMGCAMNFVVSTSMLGSRSFAASVCKGHADEVYMYEAAKLQNLF